MQSTGTIGSCFQNLATDAMIFEECFWVNFNAPIVEIKDKLAGRLIKADEVFFN